MTSDPQKLRDEELARLHEFNEKLGPIEFRFTMANVTLQTPGYPQTEPQTECSSQPWDRNAKHPLHDRIMAWRAKR